MSTVSYYDKGAENFCWRAGFYPLSTGSFNQYIIKLINLSKYLKGSITIGELENMPNRYVHAIYKQYVNFLNSAEEQKAAAMEEVMDEMT